MCHGEHPLLGDEAAAAEVLGAVLQRGQPGEGAQGRLLAVVHPGAGLLPAAAPELGLAEGGLGAEAGLEDLAGVGALVHAGEEGAAVTIRPGTMEILRLDIIDMTTGIYNTDSCKSHQKP